MVDAPSVLYEEKQYNVSGVHINKLFRYSMETKKPKYISGTFSVGAVLSVGWCPNSESKDWVRSKDYVSVYTLPVPLKEDQSKYQVIIPVVYYCKYLSTILLAFICIFCFADNLQAKARVS